MIISRNNLKSISQIAMLGIVTANLRAVTITVLAEELMLNFFYENSPSEEEIQLSKSSTKKISSSIGKILIKEQQIVLPQPAPIPLKRSDQWVYHRYEGNPPLFKVKTLFKDVTLTSVRCASQIALLGSIPRNLRAVSINFFEKDLTMDFYYDKKPINNLDALIEWGLAESAFLNTIYNLNEVEGKIRRFETPEPEKISLQEGGFWIYMRYEKQSS